MTDEKLYELCRQYGAQALEARRKFIGLLPEVYRRKLYLKKGFESIHEFAAKLAGVSHDQVNRVLQLDKKYEDKPVLLEALVEGEISVNKLARIASIATVENQQELVEKADKLSKAALDVYVKDYKIENGLVEPSEAVPGHSFDFEILSALSSELKLKMKELMDKGFDINQLFLQFLKQREAGIQEEKEKLAFAQQREQEEKAVLGMPTSRHVPVKILRVIKQEFGTKCSAPNCNKRAQQLHHEEGFAKIRIHDPRYLKSLCKEHHELTHVNDEKVQQYRMAL